MHSVPFAFVTIKFERICIDSVYDTCIFSIQNINELLLLRSIQEGQVCLFGFVRIEDLSVSFGRTKEEIEARYKDTQSFLKKMRSGGLSAPIYFKDLAEFLAKIGGFSWKESFDRRK